MKRSSFLSCLFLPALAAQTPTPPVYVNGQCPVCKTVAPVYTKAERMADGYCTDTDGRLTVKPCSPAARLVRCVACSAAFWQDVAK